MPPRIPHSRRGEDASCPPSAALRAAERELSIYPVTCADAGEYTVVVSNDLGSVTTLAGILIVPDCP